MPEMGRGRETINGMWFYGKEGVREGLFFIKYKFEVHSLSLGGFKQWEGHDTDTAKTSYHVRVKRNLKLQPNAVAKHL